jgi:hypothetical protein
MSDQEIGYQAQAAATWTLPDKTEDQLEDDQQEQE